MGSICGKAHALPHNTHSNGQHTSGAMDESARQLKRLAHISRFVRIHIGVGQRCYAIDAESSTLPGKASAALVTFQRGDGGNFRESSKMQAHRTSGVVMDIAAFKVSHSVGRDRDATALRAARARSSSIGALDESSRRAHI